MEEIRRSYLGHRKEAKRRGVEFLFTLNEWCAWWQFDMRWKAQGLCGHDLVMVRFGDAGPFAPENVYCCTAEIRTLTGTHNCNQARQLSRDVR